MGRFQDGDREQRRQALQQQDVHNTLVMEHLVSAEAQDLLPWTLQGRTPATPFSQLWIAATIQSLDDFEIERLTALPAGIRNDVVVDSCR